MNKKFDHKNGPSRHWSITSAGNVTNLPVPDACHILDSRFLLWDIEYILDQGMLMSDWAMDEQRKILFNILCMELTHERSSPNGTKPSLVCCLFFSLNVSN